MKKSVIAIMLALFISANYAQATESIAVVDLQKIVSNSNEVKQLKQDHSRKMDELNKIVVNARGAIANEKDAAKVLQLEDKFTKEFNQKKSALEKEYQTKLSNIEKNIKTEITKKALENKYDYVFAKSVLLYGGKDITNDISIK